MRRCLRRCIGSARCDSGVTISAIAAVAAGRLFSNADGCDDIADGGKVFFGNADVMQVSARWSRYLDGPRVLQAGARAVEYLDGRN